MNCYLRKKHYDGDIPINFFMDTTLFFQQIHPNYRHELPRFYWRGEAFENEILVENTQDFQSIYVLEQGELLFVLELSLPLFNLHTLSGRLGESLRSSDLTEATMLQRWQEWALDWSGIERRAIEFWAGVAMLMNLIPYHYWIELLKNTAPISNEHE